MPQSPRMVPMTAPHSAPISAQTPQPVLVIAGPTASGKSGLALELAERFDGRLINADSMQLYRELEILTARPGAAELMRAPHRLFGALPAADPCSAGRWREFALAEIAAAHRARQLPILVGGSGLYLRSLIEGIAEIPTPPPAIRDELSRALTAQGYAALLAELTACDAPTAARLQPNDPQRLLRALGVYRATGRPISDWHRAAPGGAPSGLIFFAYRLEPARDRLYRACDLRLEKMLAAGAIEETRQVLALGLDPALPAMKAIGLREFGDHLSGHSRLDEALAAAQQATRNYAKRQGTWFRNQFPAAQPIADDPQDAQFLERFFREIFSKISEFPLTASN